MIDANDFELSVSISVIKDNYSLTVHIFGFEFPNRACYNLPNCLICIGCLLKRGLEDLMESLQE